LLRVSNKGPAILDGRLFRTTLDAFVIALDMKTGKEIWRSRRPTGNRLLDERCAAGRQRRGDHRHVGAPSTARADFWTVESGDGRALWHRYTIPGPEKKGLKAGRQATPICTEAAQPGSRVHTIQSSDLVYWGTAMRVPVESNETARRQSVYRFVARD